MIYYKNYILEHLRKKKEMSKHSAYHLALKA